MSVYTSVLQFVPWPVFCLLQGLVSWPAAPPLASTPGLQSESKKYYYVKHKTLSYIYVHVHDKLDRLAVSLRLLRSLSQACLVSVMAASLS